MDCEPDVQWQRFRGRWNRVRPVIPATANITEWSQFAPWPTRDQVEQDLVMSRLIVEIANDATLGDELALRGGTGLHKLVLAEPLRFSGGLDYVRVTHGPIGAILDAIRQIGGRLGLTANTDVGTYPKVRLRAPFESGSGPMRIKVQINTYETSPAQPLRRVEHSVDSPWWSGAARVLTFSEEELAAMKLRALFQRRKGRDLFDLWLALTLLELDPAEVVACFGPHRPKGYTAERARQGLYRRLADRSFRRDLLPLLRHVPEGWEIDIAAALVRDELLSRV